MKRILFLLVILATRLVAQPVHVVPGADRLLMEYFPLIKGKNVALVTNHTGLLRDGRHLADVLSARSDVKLVALFGPEHGIRGAMDEAVADMIDAKTGVPVFSLYGRVHTPTTAMLHGVDVLLFDVQDIGARFYTYITTLGHVMEAAARDSIPMVVLDRPNPIRGVMMEGPIAEDTLRSFVAFGPLPITHGLTIGELARLYNGAHMLAGGRQARLTVVPVEGWRRSLWFDQTDLHWVKPSPNMPTLAAATVYPGICLFEGTNISEGRGTPTPFELVGAPWADGKKVVNLLNTTPQASVRFEPIVFTPDSLPWLAKPKYVRVQCKGVRIVVMDRDSFEPVRTGIRLLWAFRTAFPDSFRWRRSGIDHLAGTSLVREWIDAGRTPEEIVAAWQEGIRTFAEIRKPYLLYAP